MSLNLDGILEASATKKSTGLSKQAFEDWRLNVDLDSLRQHLTYLKPARARLIQSYSGHFRAQY